MNSISIADLKSATDPNLPFYSHKIVIDTSEIKKDILNEFGCMAKAVIISNEDPQNSISVTIVDPSAPVDTIPPATKGESDQWTSYIDLVPNNVTGKGILELLLVPLKDARK